MKPTLIDRYLLLQFIPYFAVSMIAFTLIFLTHQLLDITNYIVNYHIDVVSVLLMLLYSLPYFLKLVIPIATMMAVLLVFIRLSADNEILALRSSGFSLWRLFYPVFGFCLACALITAFISIWAMPRGRMAFKRVSYRAISASPEIGIKERQFNNAFQNVTLYVGEYQKRGNRLSDIFIKDQQTVGASVSVSAPSGDFVLDRQNHIFRINLYDGIINQADPAQETFHSIRFERYEVNLDIKEAVKDIASPSKGKKEMKLGELCRYIESMEEKDSHYYSALMTLHEKFSVPFACLALGLLALPLGVRRKSTRASTGIGLALLCFLGYYLMESAGEILVEAGHIPPVFGSWLPNLVMLGMGIFLMTLAGGDRSLGEFFRRKTIRRRQAFNASRAGER